MKQEMYEDKENEDGFYNMRGHSRGRGNGGCGCGGKGQMHGMGRAYEEMDFDVEALGPLHKENLIRKLKLYKEDLEAQANYIEKRIKEIESGSSESK